MNPNDNTQEPDMKVFYLSMSMVKEIGVSVLGRETLLPFTDHADGTQGAMIVFDTYEHAKAYSPKNEVIAVSAKGQL